MNRNHPFYANVNATESDSSTNAKIKSRINVLLLSLSYAYDACTISFDENDGDRLNITGNYATCVANFCPAEHDTGTALMHDTLAKLRNKGFVDSHPWVSKLQTSIQCIPMMLQNAQYWNFFLDHRPYVPM